MSFLLTAANCYLIFNGFTANILLILETLKKKTEKEKEKSKENSLLLAHLPKPNNPALTPNFLMGASLQC